MNSAEPSIRRLPRPSDIRKSKQTFAAIDINVCYADKVTVAAATTKIWNAEIWLWTFAGTILQTLEYDWSLVSFALQPLIKPHIYSAKPNDSCLDRLGIAWMGAVRRMRNRIGLLFAGAA